MSTLLIGVGDQTISIYHYGFMRYVLHVSAICIERTVFALARLVRSRTNRPTGRVKLDFCTLCESEKKMKRFAGQSCDTYEERKTF